MNSAIDSARRKHQSSALFEADLVATANDDGVTSVKVTDPDTVNLVWAKLYGSDERIVQAYNTRVQPRDKCPVWLRQLADGTFEVEGGRARDGSDLYQEAAGTVFLQELIGELLATVWGARNLKPGRARLSELGGMNLYIEAFFHSTGYFGGDDIDLTAYIPATASTHAWVKVWYDPVSDVLGATLGTEYGLPYTLTKDDLGAISISPNYIPLAGVILTNGDTALSAASVIEAAQNWIDAPISSEQFFPIEITNEYTIPVNRQIAVRRLAVTGSGVLTVNGVLDVF
jgi:hypothetical protein